MRYMEWVSTRDRLPNDEYESYRREYRENPEFIAFISGAIVSTVLLFDGTGFYAHEDDYDDGEHDYFDVTHWMMMPPTPEKCRVKAEDLGPFDPEYEAFEAFFAG